MNKSQGDPMTAENLEQKFDRGEDVLDYFDVSRARVVRPRSKTEAKAKFAYPVRRNSTGARLCGKNQRVIAKNC